MKAKNIELVKGSVAVLKTRAEDITKRFYPILFESHPEVVPYFNQTNQGKGTQARALAATLIAYGENIQNLDAIKQTVIKIVQKHCSLGVKAEHYPAVGTSLLKAISLELDISMDSELIQAWKEAYFELADIFIEAEESVYIENEQAEGGWRGERDFELIKKVNESEVICSFYFKPVDGKAIPEFKPGQFITIIAEVNGQSIRRNYSLSDAPGKEYLRISIKRELQGVMSNYLHDHLDEGQRIKLLPPCGDFVLQKNQKPLVLVTAGVGITPAISMLNAESGSDRKISFIHAADNSRVHAFKEHLEDYKQNNTNLSTTYIYREPLHDCEPDAVGMISSEVIEQSLNGNHDVEFYLLGPKGFMQTVLNIAKNIGIPDNQIHYEFFGPMEELAV